MARRMGDATRAEMAFRARVRGNFFDKAQIKRMFDDMTHRALYNAGYDVKQAAKKGVGKRTKVGSKSRKSARPSDLVEIDGGLYQDLTMLGSGRPRPPGKPASSWPPRRFLYYSISDEMGRGPFGPTAIIGTWRTPWLAQLHEFGGTRRLTAYRLGVGAARNAYLRQRGNGRQGRDERGRWTSALPHRNQYEYGAVIWSHTRPRGRLWQQTSVTKTARYPARPFMQGAAGVQKALAKANLKFRNALKKAS